jgi:outer membrane protein
MRLAMLRHGAAALALAAMLAPAHGETLRDALVRTYSGNPTLTGARSRLRAIDEGVGIARSNGRPQVTGTTGITQDFRGIARFRNGGRALTAGVDITRCLGAAR